MKTEIPKKKHKIACERIINNISQQYEKKNILFEFIVEHKID